jgi:Tfp pilus assembly ATPase PilU
MQTFDQSLFQLVQSGLISMEEALHNASNADEFKMRLSGILSAEQAMNTMRQSPVVAPTSSASRDADSVFVKH